MTRRARRSLYALMLGVALAIVPLDPLPASAAPPPAPRSLAAAVAGTGSDMVTPVVEAPGRFDLAGLSYDGPSGADIELRVSDDGTTWSPWYHAADTEGEGPDRTSPERGAGRTTHPVWTGPARYAQFRVESPAGPVRNLRLQAVDAQGHGESLVDRIARHARGIWRSDTPPAAAMTDQPRIVTRAEWGADESIRRDDPSYGRVQLAFVHHTVHRNDYSPSEAPALVRGIYAYHVRSNGWNDIGYNFLVDRFGTVYEGRYGGVDRAVIGAHTEGFNSASFGASLLGTFTSEAPAAPMLDSLQRLLAWRLDVAHVDPDSTTRVVSRGSNRFPAGTEVTLRTISGHRDAGQTACPGELAYRELAGIRSAVDALGRPKIYSPAVEPGVLQGSQKDGYGSAAITATASDTLTWTATVSGPTGAEIRRFTAAGANLSVTWDGTDGSGDNVVPGVYQVSIAGRGAAGEARPAIVEVAVDDVTDDVRVLRLAGTDRYGTAAAAAGQVAPSAVTDVVLASGDTRHLVDSLVAAPLAKAKSAPLLLTAADALPSVVRGELDRLRPQRAWVIGGRAAVGDAVVDDLSARGITVNRLAGVDAPATAAAVARALGGPRPNVVVVARESDHLVDGLAAAGPAAGLGRPVLLVNKSSVPPATSQVMTELGAADVWAVGGRSAIDDRVVAQLRARRVAGSDRWSTAVAVTEAAVAAGLSPDVAVVASGETANLVDALAGGAFGEMVLLTARTQLPAVTADALRARSGPVEKGFVVGGTAAVSDDAVSAVAGALNP